MTSLVTAFVPSEYHGTTFEEVATVNGNTTPRSYHSRLHNGHVVVDVPLGFFQRMLAGPQGKLWVDNNPAIMQWLGEADRRDMSCNAFPGEQRAPALAPLAPAAPVMVRMRAPDGCSSASFGGVDIVIGDDRMVTVTEDAAEQ